MGGQAGQLLNMLHHVSQHQQEAGLGRVDMQGVEESVWPGPALAVAK